MALTREQIVRSAVTLLDQVGLAGLTLRRLAHELGVSAPALYWHVRHKRELLDLMADAMLEESTSRSGSPRHGQPWWDWLAEQSLLQWRALLAHRDAALVLAGNRPTESSLPLVEEKIRTLVTVGFPPDEALHVILTLSHYVIGSAVEYQAEAARARDADDDYTLAEQLRHAEDLPYLATAAFRGRPDPAQGFERGLALFIGGLRARHAELTRPDLEAAASP